MLRLLLVATLFGLLTAQAGCATSTSTSAVGSSTSSGGSRGRLSDADIGKLRNRALASAAILQTCRGLRIGWFRALWNAHLFNGALRRTAYYLSANGMRNRSRSLVRIVQRNRGRFCPRSGTTLAASNRTYFALRRLFPGTRSAESGYAEVVNRNRYASRRSARRARSSRPARRAPASATGFSTGGSTGGARRIPAGALD